MHDSYLDSAKLHYFAAIVLGAFCWFKPHPFASSKSVLYTKRDCCEITIFLLSTITPRVCFFRGGQKKKNKSCFIFLGALQSPWRLFKMRLKRHAAVRKELIFSVTHWVIESLQARWPALVKIISRVHPISNDRGKKKKKRRRREEQNIHSRDIQHDWVWLHDLLTPTHLPVRGSLFTPRAFFFYFYFFIQASLCFGTSSGLRSPGHIFSAFVSDVFNMNYLPQRDTALDASPCF